MRGAGLDIFSTPLVVADKSRSKNSVVMSATPYLKERYGIPNVCRIGDLPQVKNMIFCDATHVLLRGNVRKNGQNCARVASFSGLPLYRNEGAIGIM